MERRCERWVGLVAGGTVLVALAAACARKSDHDEPEPTQVAAAQVQNQGLPAGLQPEVDKRLGDLAGCLPPDLRKRTDLRLTVRARLAEDGGLRDASVTGEVSLPPMATQCLGDVLAKIRVPEHDGSSRIVTFPLWFRDGTSP